MSALAAIGAALFLIVWALAASLSMIGIWAALDEGNGWLLLICIVVAAVTWAPVVAS